MRSFGVELEVGSEVPLTEIVTSVKKKTAKPVQHSSIWKENSNNPYWMVKPDSSCGKNFIWNVKKDQGWEIVSFKASTLEDLEEICSVADQLKEDGCLVNDNCGLHVHADVSDFTIENIGTFFSRWMKIEQKLCTALPKRRVRNNYSKLISESFKFSKKKSYTAEQIWDKIRPTNLYPHENPQKKYAINSVSLAASLQSGLSVKELAESETYRCTLELRLPEGTLDREDIKNWVLLFISVLDSAKKSKVDENLLAVYLKKDFFSYCGISNNQSLKDWFDKRVVLHKADTEERKKADALKKAEEDKIKELKKKAAAEAKIKSIAQFSKQQVKSVKKPTVSKKKKEVISETKESLDYILACAGLSCVSE